MNVLRYKKLKRSTRWPANDSSVSDEPASQADQTITPTATTARTTAITFARPRSSACSPMNSSGQARYHCSSTARLHRWRSTGTAGEKYGTSPKICAQFDT